MFPKKNDSYTVPVDHPFGAPCDVPTGEMLKMLPKENARLREAKAMADEHGRGET